MWSHADIQRLKHKPHAARVILVYGGQGRSQSSSILDWLVEVRRGGDKPLPAVLSTHHRTSADTPGTTLVAEGDDDLGDDLSGWLQQNEALFRLPEVGSSHAVTVDTDRLRGAIRQTAKGRSLSVRDLHIVRGLVAGIRCTVLGLAHVWAAA